jgi:hypothetical protein
MSCCCAHKACCCSHIPCCCAHKLRGGHHMSCCQPHILCCCSHKACCCAHEARGGHHMSCCWPHKACCYAHMACCQPHKACCCAHMLRGGHHKACCHAHKVIFQPEKLHRKTEPLQLRCSSVLSREVRRLLVAEHRTPDRAPSTPRPQLSWLGLPGRDQTERPMTGPRALSPRTAKL